jgi:hypothetical protein
LVSTVLDRVRAVSRSTVWAGSKLASASASGVVLPAVGVGVRVGVGVGTAVGTGRLGSRSCAAVIRAETCVTRLARTSR